MRTCFVAMLSFAAVLPVRSAAPSVGERVIALILDAPAATNAVWPGFSLPDRDWLLYDATGAYLVTKSAPPASFAPTGRWFHRAGVLAGLHGTIDWAYRLGDLSVTAIPTGKSPEGTASEMYHEAFHTFQHARFAPLQPGPQQTGDRGGEITAELAASIEIERRALREAIRAKGIDQSIRYAVAVRAQRATMSGSAIQIAERTSERLEGLAQYVQEYSMALALRRSARAPIDAIAARLALPMRVVPGSPDERVIRARAYGTGAAMAVLLDRLGVDWKAQTQAQGEPLDVLLAKHVALPADSVSKLVADAYRRYGHDALLASKKPSWGELVGLTDQQFDALAPYRLVLEIPASTSVGWNLSSGNGHPSGMHRPAPGVLLLPFIDRFTAQGEGFSAVITNRSVRMDTREAPPTITILLPGSPRLNGEGVAADLDIALSSVRIETEGVIVTLARPVRVTSQPQALRVASK